MKFIINNQIVSREVITYRGLGFGENITAPVKYRFEILLSDFLKSLKDEINQFIKESKIDDEWISIKELADLNYPEVDYLLNNKPEILAVVIRRYFNTELLEWLFDDNPKEKWEYAINSIDNVEINNNILIFSGDCYSLQKNINTSNFIESKRDGD